MDLSFKQEHGAFRDEVKKFLKDELTEELSEHPLFDLLANASEWLTPLWPTMMALLETKMQHPGAPDATFEDFGFGHHEDLVP